MNGPERSVIARMGAFEVGGSDFSGFLYAEIGVEPSGMSLSVLSAMARMGLDPWTEARRLAGVSHEAAVAGLALLISAMPASVWQLPEATGIAGRLVVLLPRQDGLEVRASPPGGATELGARARMMVIVVLGVAALANAAVQLSRVPEAPRPAAAASTPPVPQVPNR